MENLNHQDQLLSENLQALEREINIHYASLGAQKTDEGYVYTYKLTYEWGKQLNLDSDEHPVEKALPSWTVTNTARTNPSSNAISSENSEPVTMRIILVSGGIDGKVKKSLLSREVDGWSSLWDAALLIMEEDDGISFDASSPFRVYYCTKGKTGKPKSTRLHSEAYTTTIVNDYARSDVNWYFIIDTVQKSRKI